MSLSALPPELIEPIIQAAIPEGFDGLALSCKDIYALCMPYLTDYNDLRRRYRKFRYLPDHFDHERFGNPTAYHLIARLVLFPEVARYVGYADLRDDTIRGLQRVWSDDSAAIARLLQIYPRLGESGLDVTAFQEKMEADVIALRHSQRAAVLLLTLLPNVEEMRLPRGWDPSCDESNKLLRILAQNKAFLSQLRKVEVIAGLSASEKPYPWDKMLPFLRLPRIESFDAHGCVPPRDGRWKTCSQDAVASSSLRSLSLASAHMTGKDIVELLRQVPYLKRLEYRHDIDSSAMWDACEFLEAIEAEMGDRLDVLHVWWRMST